VRMFLIWICVVVVSLPIALYWIKRLIEFWNNFYGGPPPSHPLPSNDTAILTRRRNSA